LEVGIMRRLLYLSTGFPAVRAMFRLPPAPTLGKWGS
jgi:hypothetical protein